VFLNVVREIIFIRWHAREKTASKTVTKVYISHMRVTTPIGRISTKLDKCVYLANIIIIFIRTRSTQYEQIIQQIGGTVQQTLKIKGE